MRDHILLFINGKQNRINGSDAFLTLSDFLRGVLSHCGTKIVCSEGDCGSCSVLCGTPNFEAKKFTYKPIDSCIRFVYQLDGCNIVTVEGLTDNEVQCTPGFVMTMTGILEDTQQPTENEWRRGLTGNLCRCTGYSPIIDAGLQCDMKSSPSMNECFEPAAMLDVIGNTAGEEIKVVSNSQTIYSPTTVDQAVEFLGQHRDAKVVAGATDVGVQFNKGYCDAQVWLDLNRIASLKSASIIGGAIVAGSGATWSDIGSLIEKDLPQFHQILTWFGSPQIRNVGTIGGNIINASPIADSLPLMFVSDAELQLSGSAGTREVNINDFYQGYKKFDLQSGELLSQVRIPLPEGDEQLRLYKISRRQDLDISSFTAAIKMKLSGSKIQSAAIAYGAVGPVVLRLPKTESFLVGKELDNKTIIAAGDIAVGEITPITDVRGGDEYRFQLARNVLLKFLHEVRLEGVLA